MLLLVGVAFIAGVVTAISPCVLPVLPIVLAGGATGGRRRPYAIVIGLVASFTAFTLAATALLSEEDPTYSQLLWEFGGAEMLIETVSLGIVPMREVLPDAFGHPSASDVLPYAQATDNVLGYLWGKEAYGAMLGISDLGNNSNYEMMKRLLNAKRDAQCV